MSNEIQFLLYNMPNADGKVQVVIKDDMQYGWFVKTELRGIANPQFK